MGMFIQGDKPFQDTVGVISDEASATIADGALVGLELDGTNDGFSVKNIGNATGAVQQFLPFGVAKGAIAPGTFGRVMVRGFCRNTIIRRATRGASTDSWASQASLAAGHVMQVDSVNHCMMTSGASQAASAFLPAMVLAESLASYASSASATSDTRTAITTAAKTFLRLL